MILNNACIEKVDMEYAYYLMDIRDADDIPENFSRVYVGWEFCANFILNSSEIDRIVSVTSRQNQEVTFIIPFIYQQELRKAQECISYLGSLNGRFEVVFNDWGVFRLINKKQNLRPVLGRLLAKQKLGLAPFLISKLTLSSHDLNYLKKSAVNSLSDFLIERSICRVELSYSAFGLDLNDVDERIKVSLHYPLSYISTSRYCRILCSEKDIPLERSAGYQNCSKFCVKDFLYESGDILLSEKVLLRGNTFFVNYGTQGALEQAESTKAIDRLVYSPG